jgi:hypothetical protein
LQKQRNVEESFVVLHNNLRRWARTSLKESEAVRLKAITKLRSKEHPVSDGAFVLRDSTSRPGCYGMRPSMMTFPQGCHYCSLSTPHSLMPALSLKHRDQIYHVLIEKMMMRYVRIKDSTYLFNSVADLIKHHCFHVHGERIIFFFKKRGFWQFMWLLLLSAPRLF